MKHSSIPIGAEEFINITSINPLISKCTIKVCYVSDEPNRNGTVITRGVAEKMAESLPGSPIVGFFNEEKKDFEGHEEELTVDENGLYFKSLTVPYGFVDLNAKVWFQKFFDDNETEREYLVTEGYIWTGQYPEIKEAIARGTNQSMELDPETTNGFWTNNSNENIQFFIINEANISKLCLLGEDVEPCFEGAQVTQSKYQFSLDENFLTRFSAMVQELKDILSEGGTEMNEETQIIVEEEIISEEISENPGQTIESEFEENSNVDEGIVENESVEETVAEESAAEEGASEYSLDDIPEYNDLLSTYSTLQSEYDDLSSRFSALEEEVQSLREFKLNADRNEKRNLIDKFCMLEDEDKADVIANIDNYSLAEIEAKLAVICFRNKVSFELDNEDNTINYNLPVEEEIDAAPAWIKAVRETAKNM